MEMNTGPDPRGGLKERTPPIFAEQKLFSSEFCSSSRYGSKVLVIETPFYNEIDANINSVAFILHNIPRTSIGSNCTLSSPDCTLSVVSMALLTNYFKYMAYEPTWLNLIVC